MCDNTAFLSYCNKKGILYVIMDGRQLKYVLEGKEKFPN